MKETYFGRVEASEYAGRIDQALTPAKIAAALGYIKSLLAGETVFANYREAQKEKDNLYAWFVASAANCSYDKYQLMDLANRLLPLRDLNTTTPRETESTPEAQSNQYLYRLNGKEYLLMELPISKENLDKFDKLTRQHNVIFQGMQETKMKGAFIFRILCPVEELESFRATQF